MAVDASGVPKSERISSSTSEAQLMRRQPRSLLVASRGGFRGLGVQGFRV